MSKKFRFCQELAEACQNLGYSGDIGYHSFMYLSEKSARDLLMWLIEKLPREGHYEQSVIDSTDLDTGERENVQKIFAKWIAVETSVINDSNKVDGLKAKEQCAAQNRNIVHFWFKNSSAHSMLFEY